MIALIRTSSKRLACSRIRSSTMRRSRDETTAELVSSRVDCSLMRSAINSSSLSIERVRWPTWSLRLACISMISRSSGWMGLFKPIASLVGARRSIGATTRKDSVLQKNNPINTNVAAAIITMRLKKICVANAVAVGRLMITPHPISGMGA